MSPLIQGHSLPKVTPKGSCCDGAQEQGPWGSASGAESRAEREPGGVKGKRPAQGVWPCGPTASPTPNGSTLGRGGSGQRELPSVKQAGGAGHPPNLRSSSGSRGPQETTGGPSASPEDQCAHSPVCTSPHPWECSLFLQGALTVSFPVGDHQGPEPPKS